MSHILHRPGYHTTHFLDWGYKHLVPQLHKISADDAHNVLIRLGCYKEARKFVLPFNGILFDNTYIPKYAPLLRLPFEQVVLEYEGTSKRFDDPNAPHDFAVSLHACRIPKDGKDGLLISVAYGYMDDWMLIPYSLWVPEQVSETEWTTGKIFSGIEVMEKVYNDWHAHRDVKQPEEVVYREAISLYQFCAALNCQNVSHETIKAPKFINQKRAAKGELPLFEYHVLTVDTRKRDEHGAAQGGHHASPREHIRRGHIRRYQTGLVIWVNQMMVGNRALGRVAKDYRMKPASGRWQ